MAEIDLPPGWHVVASKSQPGRVYYFNDASRATRWTKPIEQKTRPEKIHCRHVLIKHNEVRNPKSKRTGEAVTRTRAEALEHIKKIYEELKKDVSSFAQTAEKESDCSTFKRGGDLGVFREKAMQQSFSKPAFALEVNEMSGIVESNSGFHIILRIE